MKFITVTDVNGETADIAESAFFGIRKFPHEARHKVQAQGFKGDIIISSKERDRIVGVTPAKAKPAKKKPAGK